jgi:hypothetical protein
MLNWELFSPRNLFAVAVMAILAFVIYNYFSKKVGGGNGS